jgi:hypothetical protein
VTAAAAPPRFAVGNARIDILRVETSGGTVLHPEPSGNTPGRHFAFSSGRLRAAMDVVPLGANQARLVVRDGASIRLTLGLAARAAPCRLVPRKNADIVQVALGAADGFDCSALYDPERDLALSAGGNPTVRAAFEGGKGVLVATFDATRTSLGLSCHPQYLKSKPASPAPDRSAAIGWDRFGRDLEATMRGFFRGDAPAGPVGLGNSLTLDQARLWATLCAVTGRAVVAEMPALAGTVAAVMPAQPIRASDLYPYDAWPRVWDVKVAHGDERYDVLAVFNWLDHPASFRVAFEDLGLSDGVYVVHDFWADAPIGAVHQGLVFTLAATSCKVLVIRPLGKYPQVLGCSASLFAECAARWDPKTGLLTGKSTVTPATLTIWAPDWETDGSTGMPYCRLPLTGGTVDWSVRLRQRTREDSTPAPTKLSVSAGPDRVGLRWDSPSTVYIVRNGELLGAAWGGMLTDREVLPETDYEYQLFPALRDGQLAPDPTKGSVRTGELSDSSLDTLEPVSPRNVWRPAERGRSNGGGALMIAGETFVRGWGVAAPRKLTFRLYRGYRRFTAKVGVDDGAQAAGGALFRVYGDGKLLFQSSVLRRGDAAASVDVDVYGVDVVALTAIPAPGTTGQTDCDWVDARLEVKENP